MYVSELAHYDIGLSDFVPIGETSLDSQRVVYEDHRAVWDHHYSPISEFFLGNIIGNIQSIIPDTISTSSPSFQLHTQMESIQRYFRGSGSNRKAFVRDAKAIYQRMLRDPRKQYLEGFGQWGFLTFLGANLSGEARDVHTTPLENWDFENEDKAYLDDAQNKETKRMIL